MSEIEVVFIIADRLRRESGLKAYERVALKRLFDKQDEAVQAEIRRSLGTKLVEEISGVNQC